MALENAWGSKLSSVSAVILEGRVSEKINSNEAGRRWMKGIQTEDVLLCFLDFTFWDLKVGQEQSLPSAVGSLICQSF